jgi:4-hydroxy-tetrahydrodipicolinate reductase
MPVEIVVLGASGRMGQMVLATCAGILREKHPAPLSVIGAVEAEGVPDIGRKLVMDGLEIGLTDSLEAVMRPGCVIIDFTAPASSMAALETARRAGAAHVLCTTGFTEEQKRRIHEVSRDIPVFMSPNTSIGITVLFKLAETVARTLGSDFDVEIIETHHNQKKDAPSGTALGFAAAVARGLELSLDQAAIFGRQGMIGARPKGQIGVHAVRGGDIVGDHTVLFAGHGERVELRHTAQSRLPLAQGAIRAALFLKGKKPGLYTMADVIGL